MVEEIIGPRGKAGPIMLLNGQSIKLLFIVRGSSHTAWEQFLCAIDTSQHRKVQLVRVQSVSVVEHPTTMVHLWHTLPPRDSHGRGRMQKDSKNQCMGGGVVWTWWDLCIYDSMCHSSCVFCTRPAQDWARQYSSIWDVSQEFPILAEEVPKMMASRRGRVSFLLREWTIVCWAHPCIYEQHKLDLKKKKRIEVGKGWGIRGKFERNYGEELGVYGQTILHAYMEFLR